MVNKRLSRLLPFAAAAAAWLAGCGQPAEQAAGPPKVDVQTEKLETKTLDLGGGVTLELVRVPAGYCRIGSPAGEPDREPNEGPQRVEHFPKGFWIGKVEVTQAQYQKLMGTNPSRFQDPAAGGELPVEWADDSTLNADAAKFIAALARVTGLPARLPTEAEWEYACRAPDPAQRGSATPPELPAYSFGSSGLGLRAFGWVDESGARTHPAGGLSPNRWGLYDMHGNVAELSGDRLAVDPAATASQPLYGQTFPVVRGGSWVSRRQDCRCAARDVFLPQLVVSGTVGLRVVVPIE